MRKIHVFIIGTVIATSLPAFAVVEPGTTCPSGYKTLQTRYKYVYNSCPNGYVNMGNIPSCLSENPGGVCMIYTPTDAIYADDTGSYQYVEPCQYTPGSLGGL